MSHEINTVQTSLRRQESLGRLVGAQTGKKEVFYLDGIGVGCNTEDVENFSRNCCRIIIDFRTVMSC